MCLFLGLCGCQANNQGSISSLPDPISSSNVEALPTRSLEPPYTFTILPLENLSPNARLHWLGRSLSEMLISDLAKSPALSIIARDALGPVLREQWLQQRGFSSSISAVDLGNIQGVHYLVNGGFHQYGDNMTINLQVIDIETGVVVSSLSAQGLQSEVPNLEHNLVMQILALLDPSIDSITSEHSNQVEETISGFSSHGRPEETTSFDMMDSELFGLHSVHQVDVQLTLERITQDRTQAYQTAEKFWREGWSAEMGQPLYRIWQSPNESDEPIPLLSIPISVFMKRNRIADVLKNIGREGILPLVKLDVDGIAREQADDTGTSKLFFEKVRQPYRLFIRAFNEYGELIAVFSDWSWQTEAILQYFEFPTEYSFRCGLSHSSVGLQNFQWHGLSEVGNMRRLTP